MPAVTSYAPRGQATRSSSNQNRQRPQRVQLFRNDNWPPRPPALDLPVPSFLTPQSPDSDTLLRALPTPSFVTAADLADTPDEHTLAAMEVEDMVTKTAPPPVPTKAVIAASAVPLADWFADVVWALYLGPSNTVGTGNSGLAGADKAPQALTAFVHAVLSQTLASPQCAALGLYYLVRLPVRLSSTNGVRMGSALWSVGGDGEGHTCYSSVPDRERAARAGFMAELYGQGVGPGGEDVPYRLAALALMLGNKWLDDHTFTNKTWHEVTHLPLAHLTALEQRALECFNYTLGVPGADWRAWLGVLREGAVGAASIGTNAVATGAAVNGGATGVGALAIEAMERLERELDVLTSGVGAGIVDVFASPTPAPVSGSVGNKGVIGDRRQSVSVHTTTITNTTATQSHPVVQTHIASTFAPACVSDMELDELEMEQVEIDIDLDDGGPVPEELRRPVKVRVRVEREEKGDVWKGAAVGGEKRGEKRAVVADKKAAVGEGRAEKRVAVVAGGDEWERATWAVKAGGDRFAVARDQWFVEEGDRWGSDEGRDGRDYSTRFDGRDRLAHDNGRDYWLPGVGDWDRARDPPVERSMMARGEYEAVQRPGVVGKGKKEMFVDEGKKGRKEMFAVGSDRAGFKAENMPRVELYDAQLQDVRAGASGYEYPIKSGFDHRTYDHAYDYPTRAYEAIPRDAMGYDAGPAYGYDPRYGYDAEARYDLGYEYAAQYGCAYVPRQVPVPVWVPQQQQHHRASSGCILS